MELTHFDDQGNAWMVDVGGKDNTERVAIAEGFIAVNKDIYNHIANKSIKKGDVLTVAQLAAIMGAKQISQLIPLCHPLSLTKVEVHCELVHGTSPACYNETQTEAIRVTATVKTIGKTGVEMEALTAVQVGLLTIYDMCKAIDKGMVMGPTQLIEKRGGNSGDFHRK